MNFNNPIRTTNPIGTINPIPRHVSKLGDTFLDSGINTQRGPLETGIFPQKEGFFRPLPAAPFAGGPGSSGKTGASDPNKSSSLSNSGEINADALDEEGGDLDKIKELEEELKKKEEAHEAESKRLEKEQENIEKEKATKLEGKAKEEKDKEIAKREEKLKEDTAKFKENQTILTEQRKQLDEVIAPPFAQKNDDGTIKKYEDKNIQFLEKKSPELEKLKQLIREKDPETIDKVRKALEEFNDYRKKYPASKEEYDNYISVTPQLGSITTQKDLITNPPSQLIASAMFNESSIG